MVSRNPSALHASYLFPAATPLGKNGLKDFEQLVIVVILFKITPQLPDKPSGYGA